MNPSSRRAFLRASCILASGFPLAACSTTTTGHVTTITLNVAEVEDYGTAILSFATTALTIPFVATAMGPASVTLAGTVIAGLKSALESFRTAAGTSTSVTYDDSSVKAAFDSLLSDVTQIDTLVIQTITGTSVTATGSVVSDARTAAGAAATLIALLRAMVDSATAMMRPPPPGRGAIATIDRFVAGRA